MVKTILHELCKAHGYGIYASITRIPGRHSQPAPIIFAYISLNLQTLAASGACCVGGRSGRAEKGCWAAMACTRPGGVADTAQHDSTPLRRGPGALLLNTKPRRNNRCDRARAGQGRRQQLRRTLGQGRGIPGAGCRAGASAGHQRGGQGSREAGAQGDHAPAHAPVRGRRRHACPALAPQVGCGLWIGWEGEVGDRGEEAWRGQARGVLAPRLSFDCARAVPSARFVLAGDGAAKCRWVDPWH